MKRKACLLGMAVQLLSCVLAAAAPASTERIAIGADIGAPLAGAFVGASSGTFSLELPLSRSWAADLDPSFYMASVTGTSILQLNLEALARFYIMSLFVADAARTAQWGPFISAGAVAAWECIRTESSVSVPAFGPMIQVGYRFVFGDEGIFFEPLLGLMALLGWQWGPVGITSCVNAGPTLGVVAGWRF